MKILFLHTADWYFRLHRLGLARAMRRRGMQVFIMTQVDRDGDFLKEEGYHVIPWQISRRSLNPFRELLTFLQVCRVYRRVKPDMVHHFTLKAVVYGGLAARLCARIPSVNSIAGLGHVFTARNFSMRILKTLVLSLLRLALRDRKAQTIFENNEDRKLLMTARVVRPERSVVIGGVGVNPTEFSPLAEPDGVPLVLLASRMLWEKGVGEFVKAAETLKKAGLRARFVLAGVPDPGNPASIPEAQLRAWADEGFVEWWGQQGDMPQVLAQSNVVCLPSAYGEGLPRILIEAAACGRAIVTTDVPGCRDIVRHEENGLLVPVRDAKALAEALARLLNDPGLRARMGGRGREIFLSGFTEEQVLEQTLSVYRAALGSSAPLLEAKGPASS